MYSPRESYFWATLTKLCFTAFIGLLWFHQLPSYNINKIFLLLLLLVSRSPGLYTIEDRWHCFLATLMFLKVYPWLSTYVSMQPDGDELWHKCLWFGASTSQIARFVWPTWGPPGSCRPQVGPMLAPWTLLSGLAHLDSVLNTRRPRVTGVQWMPAVTLYS